MKALSLVFVGIIWLEWAGSAPQRQRHEMLGLWTTESMELYMGEPEQAWTMAALSTKFSELILIDSECGLRDSGCPSYCNDAILSPMYCKPMCAPITEHTFSFTCSTDRRGHYYGNQSKYAELVKNGEWRKTLPNTRPMFGRLWRDQVMLYQFRMSRPRGSELGLKIFNATFVGAKMFDRRIIRFSHAIFGIRPGPNSAVREFMNGLGVQRPVISFSLSRQSDVPRHPALFANSFLTLGAVDMWRCAEWKWTPTISATDFAVLVPTVDFMGVKLENILVTFDLREPALLLPQPIMQTLLEAGTLQLYARRDGFHFFTYDCIANRPLRFLDSNDRPLFQLDNSTLVNVYASVKCFMQMAADSSNPDYYQRAEFPILNVGMMLQQNYCLGYDYERNWIGFGRRRPWSHPMLDGNRLLN